MKYLLSALTCLLVASATFAQSPGWAGASWIWDEADAHKITQNNDPRHLRCSFELAAKPAAAELWVTADNHYVAHVNGQKVGADAEWNTVEKYDVVKHLVIGKNVLAIQATNQGGVAGAIARLHIKTADKKDVFIVTDDKTKIRRAEPRKGPGDAWTAANFDDSAWFNAIILGDPGIGPWNLVGGAAKGKGKGKKGAGPFGYDTNAVDPKVKTRLSAEAQKKHFIVPKDFEIELVAADPLVINPITMVMDDQGRIIVSESHTYRYGPKGSPIKPYANPVIRLDPDGKGGFKRTLIADGFADPVMGIAVKGDKLWLTACNYLYTYDLPQSPGTAVPGKDASGKEAPVTAVPGLSAALATNKKTIVTDLNKAWNPFGMFVLEWGPDGKLYMSVGNHAINMVGPDKEKMSGRGSSGIVVRMNPDGSKMERLVHGLRVPYSFEMDPFGQLWVLSNGEGNPNRFVRVIDGVDYHCYSRGAVDNNWLAGNHPLAPPSEELHRGAHTQLMRYYGAAYPAEYQGNLFLCNWGAHGFAGPNRAINRFVLDERNNVVKREPLVHCTDPHFRPAHIILDQDGSLLIADWYGRDDESDMTGRIWRLKYVGKDAPVVKHKLDSAEWKNDDYAISALGSPSHLIRAKAVDELSRSDRPNNPQLGKLLDVVATSGSPLAAANACWLCYNAQGVRTLHSATQHSDWRVRRLANKLCGELGHMTSAELDPAKGTIAKEIDPAVLVAMTSALAKDKKSMPEHVQSALSLAFKNGAAADTHLRYEAAFYLAKHGDEKSIVNLLTADDANVCLAGLIAIDVACYENFPTKKAALAALAKALESPGKLDQQLLLMVAQLDGDASVVPGLLKMLERDDLPTATIAKAFLVLKSKAGPSLALPANKIGKRIVEAVEKGSLKIASPTDQLVLFEFLESEGPTPFALKQIAGQLQSSNAALKEAAHTLARRFGPKAEALAPQLWPSVLNPKTKFADTVEYLSTLARVETGQMTKGSWDMLLDHDDPHVRAEAVRWWRRFDRQPGMVGVLVKKAADLVKRDPSVKEDLATVFRQFGIKSGIYEQLGLPDAQTDKAVLTKYAVQELAAMPAGDRAKRAAMGLQVFERSACTKCHTTAIATTPLAPSLKGIAGQKVDYLIESVLYPSKIIKTGFESELIELKSGKTLTGLVKDDGKYLRVLNLDKEERVAKSDIESRAVTRVSVMPDGQEATLSRREFVDLIAYLATLK